MEKITLNVFGMSCSHCEKAVTTALMDLEGVSSVKIELAENKVEVEYDSGKISVDTIKAEIIETGYEVK